MVKFSENVEFLLVLAMDPVTIFDPSCEKQVLVHKGICKLAFGDNFELFKPYLNDRILSSTPEFSMWVG